ncbi:MAG: S9 family peptidase, partial [Rhizobacter sp.]|nr:S9 family peptidase [Chlorobiales bacterium]
MTKTFLLVMFIAAALTASPRKAKSQEPLQPPVAKKIAKVDSIHGETRTDNYFWLREKTNPEVISYLNAENAYTESIAAPLQKFSDTLYKEILSHIKQTDLSVPYKQGNYFYYSRTEKGKQYAAYCRKKNSLRAKEEIVLDLNTLAKGKKFLSLGAYIISDDEQLLAYSLDTTGFRQYTLYVKNLKTGKNLGDALPLVSSAAWAADNKTIFYATEDAAKRAYRLMRHTLGADAAKDALLYEEKDELYRIGVYRSRDKKFIFMASASSETSETRYVESDKPSGEFTVLLPRETDHEYYADHRDGLFYIRTNKGAKNFRLVTAKVSEPQKWTELVAHRPDVKLEDIDVFKNHAVLTERDNGLTKLRIMDLADSARGGDHTAEFPEPTYSVFAAANPEFNTELFRFSYQSFVTPNSVYDYDMTTRTRKLLKQTEVPGGFNASNYVSERRFAVASDGVKIPVSIVSKKDVKRDGTAPMLLYGYGSYGFPLPVTFSPARLALLDRGVVFVMAHIRGGGDMGEVWHDDGKMMKKKNTFTDFVACADFLIAEKYASRDRLAIEGGSAGGLLIGAVLNLRPDVCKVAHLAVPFVDVVNTMLDASLPLTVGEYLEWGNPNVKAEYDYIKSYCP